MWGGGRDAVPFVHDLRRGHVHVTGWGLLAALYGTCTCIYLSSHIEVAAYIVTVDNEELCQSTIKVDANSGFISSIPTTLLSETESCTNLYICTHMRISVNHNSLGCKQPPGLDVKQSLNEQDMFRPIPGLISCTGVTG